MKETISPNIDTTALQNQNNENLKSNLEIISTTNQNNQNEDQKSNVTTSLLDKLKSIKLKISILEVLFFSYMRRMGL